MLRVKATYAFSGNPQESQLSFPAGAILEASPDGHHAPRQGWMHGKYQHQAGWFPESYVVVIDDVPTNRMNDSCPPSAPPPPPPQQQQGIMPTATAYAYHNNDGSDPHISVPPLSASAPPVVMALPVPAAASNNNNSHSYSAPRKELREDQLSQLIPQGYTRGLAKSLNDTLETFAKRIWIVDNSGSMQKTDGHRLVETGKRQHVKFVECSRWEEITECVCYHIQLAALLEAPTSFRLLNNPGAHVGPQHFTIDTSSSASAGHVQQALQVIRKARPGGCTPLTDHILAINSEIEAMLPELRARGQKVAVVIATDGLPTDDRGYGGKAHQDQFVNALRTLEGLPVWVVIRLCTDEEDVVSFYNDLDQLLELSMEVLDDFCGEAEEVHEFNPWLNYALPLHRMREMGFHERIFDLLDERPLTKSELRDFCSILLGEGHVDGMPDPSLDWEGFLRRLDAWLKKKDEAPEQWNPMKKKVKPWLDLHKLNSVYGDGSCSIL